MLTTDLQTSGELRAFEDMPAEGLLAEAINGRTFGRAVLVSSFGSESAVLLHMVSQIDRGFPILFLDTQKLFGETLQYYLKLADSFGLTAIDRVQPDPLQIEDHDRHGCLWSEDPDSCCRLRKTEPLERALRGFDAWITGRKRYQGASRESLSAVETSAGRYKINPLVGWRRADVDTYFAAHNLPRHPLESRGFSSIGCLPCTDRIAPGEDLRAGRWRGTSKTECGIHLSAGASTPRLPQN